jgi:hypothetical protein
MFLADIITTTPDSTAMPGAPQLMHLLGGIEWAAFFAAVAAAVIGGAIWAIAGQSGNYQHATRGKQAVIAAVIGAVLIGAGPHIVQFFFSLGSQVSNG